MLGGTLNVPVAKHRKMIHRIRARSPRQEPRHDLLKNSRKLGPVFRLPGSCEFIACEQHNLVPIAESGREAREYPRRDTMQPNTSDKQFSEDVLRQVLVDARRALIRGHFKDRSSIELVRCIDYQPETDRLYGSQLWFFDASAIDENNKQQKVFGVIEYSLQYGMYELIEDGVFESIEQRSRFRSGYRGILPQPRWRDPAHRWLLAAVLAISAATLAYYALRVLAR